MLYRYKRKMNMDYYKSLYMKCIKWYCQVVSSIATIQKAIVCSFCSQLVEFWHSRRFHMTLYRAVKTNKQSDGTAQRQDVSPCCYGNINILIHHMHLRIYILLWGKTNPIRNNLRMISQQDTWCTACRTTTPAACPHQNTQIKIVTTQSILSSVEIIS